MAKNRAYPTIANAPHSAPNTPRSECSKTLEELYDDSMNTLENASTIDEVKKEWERYKRVFIGVEWIEAVRAAKVRIDAAFYQ